MILTSLQADGTPAGISALAHFGQAKGRLPQSSPRARQFRIQTQLGTWLGLWLILAVIATMDCRGASTIPVQSFIDYSATPYDTRPTAHEANLSTVGYAPWRHRTNFGAFLATNAQFASWHVVSNASRTFITPRSIGGTNFSETGTHWLRVYHTNENQPEHLYYATAGGQGSAPSNMMVRGMVRFSGIKTNSGNVNYDHIYMQGTPYFVMQQQLFPSPGINRIVTHVEGELGLALDGIDTNKVYEFKMFRDTIRGVGHQAFYDSGVLVGEDEISLPGSALYGSYEIHHTANYADLGTTVGFTEFGGLSVQYGNAELVWDDDGNPEPATATASKVVIRSGVAIGGGVRIQ